MATSPELEIVWDGGSLDLMGENDTAYGPVAIQALADGTEWGNPQSVRRALFSALADGSASALERHDNRTITVRLRLTAPDSAALAGGEAPLHMLSGVKRAELRWTPPNDFAAPAAFIVVASDLTHQMDDFAENRCRRLYTLTLVCLPFALSIDPVVIEALPPFVAAPATLDDCTSTTGWASLIGGATFAVVSGGVQISAPYNGGLSVNATLTKSIARTKRYLAIEAELVSGQHFIGGMFRPLIRTDSGWMSGNVEVVGAEGKWTFYDVPHGLGAVQEIRFGFFPPTSGGTHVLANILTIAESDTPAASAGRQSLRIIPTPGSARAAGSLLVESRDAAADGTGTAQGRVIVYTGPQYDPRLSVNTSSVRTVDADAMSGKCSTGTSHIYARGVNFPHGSYGIWANVKGTAGPVDWTIDLKAINRTTGGTLADLTTLSTSTTLVGTGYNLHHLGAIDLPGLALDSDSLAALRFFFTTDVSVSIDEILVFNRTLGTLTIVDTTDASGLVESPPGSYVTTAGATSVWLDAASLERGAGILVGRSARAHALPVSLSSVIRAWDGAHLFTPDSTFLYVGTSGPVDPKVVGTFRPAWHTHPAS